LNLNNRFGLCNYNDGWFWIKGCECEKIGRGKREREGREMDCVRKDVCVLIFFFISSRPLNIYLDGIQKWSTGEPLS
jgi:hypothetical protein